jgi:hypothetical protein
VDELLITGNTLWLSMPNIIRVIKSRNMGLNIHVSGMGKIRGGYSGLDRVRERGRDNVGSADSKAQLTLILLS